MSGLGIGFGLAGRFFRRRRSSGVYGPDIDTGGIEDVTRSRNAASGVLANDSDPDALPLTVTSFAVSGISGNFPAGTTANVPGFGTAVINATGSWTITPAPDFFGAFPPITYTATNGVQPYAQTLSVSFVNVNDAPVAVNDNIAAAVSTSASVNLFANDTDIDSAVLNVTAWSWDGVSKLPGESHTIAGKGTLTIAANGEATFTAAAGGTNPVPDALYTVSDGAATAQATLALSINGGGGTVNRADLLTAPALALANTIDNHFTANDWNPDIDAIVWDDTIRITSRTQLLAFLRTGTAVNGVTINVTRNQRVQLAADGDFSHDPVSGLTSYPEVRGKDFAGNGKVLLIEPETISPQILHSFRVLGSRGIYLRNLDFVGGPDLYYPNHWNTWAPASLLTLTIVTPGTGYSVGQSLAFTGTYDQPPVATVSSVDGSGGITGIAITNGGQYVYNSEINNASLITGVSVSGGGSGAVITVPARLTNPRDTPQFWLTRSSSFPAFPVAILDGCKIGRGHVYPNEPMRWGICVDANNAEQLTVKNCVFKGYETALKCNTVRRFRWKGCDFQLAIGDTNITLNTAATTVIGGVAFSTAWPDKISYSWSSQCTMRNLYDNANAVNARGNDLRFSQQHCDFNQLGTNADTGGYAYLCEFNHIYSERVTYVDRLGFRNNGAPDKRIAGGPQVYYRDDSTYRIDGVLHNNIGSCSTAIALRSYNGETHSERNSWVRPGHMPPSATVGVDGFNFSYDLGALQIASKKSSWAGPAVLNSTNNILTATVIDSVPVNGTVVSNGDVIADPRVGAGVGARYQDIFAGTFFTENGITAYNLTDNGSNSRQAFAAAHWAIIAPVASPGKGASNPATWPT